MRSEQRIYTLERAEAGFFTLFRAVILCPSRKRKVLSIGRQEKRPIGRLVTATEEVLAPIYFSHIRRRISVFRVIFLQHLPDALPAPRARNNLEMPSCGGTLRMLRLLLILAVLHVGSSAVRKVRKAPAGFRYTRDLVAAATNHGGTVYI